MKKKKNNEKSKEKIEKMKRDNSIDFFRGFAALWIIFIHTCYGSGNDYVSLWLQSLCLIIDVPLFVFISGMTFNFSLNFIKGIKNLVKIWYKWLLFLLLFFGISIITEGIDVITIDNIIRSIFFNISGLGNRIVYDSIWFIFMFFIVTIIGNAIICIYKKNNDDLSNFKYILMFLFILMGMRYFMTDEFTKYFIFDTNIFMYTFFYCLGFYLYNYKIKGLKEFLIILTPIILVLLLFLNFSTNGFYTMQASKLMRYFTYFVYSLPSIIIVTYLKDIIKVKEKNIICFVGQNALLFYFCQGIGSSIMYYIIPYIIDLPGTIIIAYIINLIITILLFIIIYFANKLISKIKWQKIKLLELKN